MSLALALTSCGQGNLFEAGIDIRGTVTTIIPAAGAEIRELGFLRIEGVKEDDTQYDKADISVNSDTRIVMLKGGATQTVPFDSLRVGQRIEATFTGPILKRNPPVATASQITILAP